jgi:hypothetical protein
MIRAGALLVSVVVAFVIALLSSFLILLSYYYKLQSLDSIRYKRLERNAFSAIHYLLTEHVSKESETEVMDLFEEGEDSVAFSHYPWGAYQIAFVKSFSGRIACTKTIMYGYAPQKNFRTAVYLVDQNRPLNLVGKTRLVGNAFLPEAGVTRGYIEGKSFVGKTLVEGQVSKSKNTLPAFDPEVLKRLSRYLDPKQLSDGEAIHWIHNLERDTLLYSFQDTTALVRLPAYGVLSGKYMAGKIIVYADSVLTVAENARLSDVILVAPKIVFQKGFKGNIQAFATDSILVEENCILQYPSVLGLFKKDHKVRQPYIKLKEYAIVQGFIFTNQSEFVRDQAQTLITLAPNSKVSGQVYADGFLDTKGIVHGSVFCNKFLLKTNSSVYENHLLDAEINFPALSEHYVGTSLLGEQKSKKIIKWLH